MTSEGDIGVRAAGEPPSSARGRREVLVAGRDAPATATATRARHLRGLANSRKYVFSLVLIGGGLFLVGASTGNLLYALIPPIVVCGVIIAMVWRRATRLAERDFFAGFALSRDMNYVERTSLLPETPLLRAGERRRCENYMEGDLDGVDGVDGVGVALAHYVYETREQRTDRRHRPISVYTPHNYTVAFAEIPRAATVFPAVHLVKRGGWFGADDWLDRDSLTSVDLDNPGMAGRYELFARPEQDRGRLLDLFKPSFQSWLVDTPFPMFFEYASGVLVVYVPRRLKRPADLDDMLIAASWIAKRILQEGEPLKMVTAALSKAPPTGVNSFPPPPPATKPLVEPALRVAPEPERSAAYTRASIPPPTVN